MTRTEEKLQSKTGQRRLSAQSHKSSRSVGSVHGKPGAEAGGGKGDSHSHLLSVHSGEEASLHSSFNEIVAIDEEGHPYIDINKLVYKPKTKVHEHHKEKLSNYIPDFGFILFNIMSLGCSTYFILLGATTLTWKASTGMFQIPKCLDESVTQFPQNLYHVPCHIFNNNTRGEFGTDPNRGYNFSLPNSYPILRTKLTEIHYFGLTLICFEVVNFINVCIGINACLQGYKAILVQHLALDGFLVLGEFIIAAIVTFTASCQPKDIDVVRILLQHFVQWYGVIAKGVELETEKEKLLNAQIDALQISLGCCGVDGWQDYLSNDFPNSDFTRLQTQEDETETVIPFSCCRPWWIRNIYCAHGAHLWAHPQASPAKALQFHERINQEGCMYKLIQLCENIRLLMGKYGFVASIVHLVFVLVEAISAIVLIRNINTLIREKKRLMKKKEMHGDPGESGSDMEVRTTSDHVGHRLSATSSHSHASGKPSPWAKIAPPTEDEILMIKHRSNFNKFMAKMRSGHVGKWVREAQEQVTEGHEEQEDLPQTAEEKKQREKELLHKKNIQRDLDDDVGSVENLVRNHMKKHRRDRHKHSDDDEIIKRQKEAEQAAQNTLGGGKGKGKRAGASPARQKSIKKNLKGRKSRKTILVDDGRRKSRKTQVAHPEEDGEEHPSTALLPPPLEDQDEFHLGRKTEHDLEDLAKDYAASGGLNHPKKKRKKKKRNEDGEDAEHKDSVGGEEEHEGEEDEEHESKPEGTTVEQGGEKGAKKKKRKKAAGAGKPLKVLKKPKRKKSHHKKDEDLAEITEPEVSPDEKPVEPKQTKVIWKKSKKDGKKEQESTQGEALEVFPGDDETDEDKGQDEISEEEKDHHIPEIEDIGPSRTPSSKLKKNKKVKKLKTKKGKSKPAHLYDDSGRERLSEDDLEFSDVDTEPNSEDDEETRRKKKRKKRKKRRRKDSKRRREGHHGHHRGDRPPWLAFF